MPVCNLCPRLCGADREGGKYGYCGEPSTLRIARIAPHSFEEPVISGTRGSGTVFFSGCTLGCVFCQNKDISRCGGLGRTVSQDELYREIIALANSGVHNVNLVTPTHFLDELIPVLKRLRASGEFSVPIVYNTSGYERVETLKRLEGLIDVYLPDFKYFSPELSKKYSGAPDYPRVASEAILEMYRQVGKYEFSAFEPDILKSGLVVRHLVLPSHRDDSIKVIEHLATLLPREDFLISLMSQYTPDFALDTPYSNLHRRITSFEYSSVVERASELGLEGFTQKKSSASASYTPNFTL